ncbi:MAG: DUF1570 domain-containing protein [Planctomycetota bacterium]
MKKKATQPVRQRAAVLVLAAALFLGGGCRESRKSTHAGQSEARQAIDTPQGMIEHLQSKHLPALNVVAHWPNQYGPGLVITTDHYEIYTTLLDPLMLSQLPGFMESAYRGYQEQLPQPVASTSRSRVFLFATRQQWEEHTRNFVGSKLAPVYLQITKGAYYLNGDCVAYNIGRKRTFSVMGHEGWHQFNSRHFAYRLPSWLDEGIAMLFETSVYEKGWFNFEPSRNLGRLGSLRQTLQQGSMIPLRQLITLNPAQVISSTEAVTAFYAQSYALVRFLREEDYGKRLPKFHQMLLGGLQGTWPLGEQERKIAADRNIQLTANWNHYVATKLFDTYIEAGSEAGELEAEYVRFCRKIVYRVRLK